MTIATHPPDPHDGTCAICGRDTSFCSIYADFTVYNGWPSVELCIYCFDQDPKLKPATRKVGVKTKK